jgi:hypothetical protein
VVPRTGLDSVEKRKFLTLPEQELRPLSRPSHSQDVSNNIFKQVLVCLTNILVYLDIVILYKKFICDETVNNIPLRDAG